MLCQGAARWLPGMPWQRPAPRDRVLFAQTKDDQRGPKVADGHTWPKFGLNLAYLKYLIHILVHLMQITASIAQISTDIHRQNMAKSCLGEVAVNPRANELVSARMAQAAGR